VTFNNNVGSTKSYDFVREHVEATATIDFVPEMKEITANYEKGTSKEVKMHDGSFIQLHKLAEGWDPLDRLSAMNAVQTARAKNEILTGLLYMNPNSVDLHELIQTSDKALNSLGKADLCPGSEALKEVNAGLR
ncbi:MAG: 2-oxoacid:ferredoxin oxidoreductase subunit beta, partial [Bacteroidia bacterium]